MSRKLLPASCWSEGARSGIGKDGRAGAAGRSDLALRQALRILASTPQALSDCDKGPTTLTRTVPTTGGKLNLRVDGGHFSLRAKLGTQLGKQSQIGERGPISKREGSGSTAAARGKGRATAPRGKEGELVGA